MSNAFYFLFGSIGLTHIVVESEMPLVKGFRELFTGTAIEKLFTCYACTGFWCGLIGVSICFPYLSAGHMFLAACSVSLLATFAATILDFLEQ